MLVYHECILLQTSPSALSIAASPTEQALLSLGTRPPDTRTKEVRGLLKWRTLYAGMTGKHFQVNRAGRFWPVVWLNFGISDCCFGTTPSPQLKPDKLSQSLKESCQKTHTCCCYTSQKGVEFVSSLSVKFRGPLPNPSDRKIGDPVLAQAEPVSENQT